MTRLKAAVAPITTVEAQCQMRATLLAQQKALQGQIDALTGDLTRAVIEQGTVEEDHGKERRRLVAGAFTILLSDASRVSVRKDKLVALGVDPDLIKQAETESVFSQLRVTKS